MVGVDLSGLRKVFSPFYGWAWLGLRIAYLRLSGDWVDVREDCDICMWMGA